MKRRQFLAAALPSAAMLSAGPFNGQTARKPNVLFLCVDDMNDYGFHCGEKDHWEKNTLGEKSCLVPAAIRVPGNTRNGEHCATPVSLVDLYPTLVDYCSLPSPKQKLEGLSLRPLIEDPAATWERPALTTYEEGYGTVRDEQFRYIVYPDGTEKLYDHRSDPNEF